MIQAPTMSEIREVSRSRGGDSCAPGLWCGLVGAWPLQEPGGLTAYDLSGYHNNGTLTTMDAATDHVVTPMGRALDFDGGNDYVTLPWSLVTAAPLTLAAWGYVTVDGVSQDLVVINKPTVGNEHSFRLNAGMAAASDPVRAITYGTSAKIATAGTISLNTWFHAAATFPSAASRTAWFNGVPGAAETSSMTPADLARVSIGCQQSTGVNFLSGRLFNPCIWNRILLPSEIWSLYTDPWGMYTLRRRVQVRGASAGIAYATNATGYLWSDAAHWTPAGVPGNGDTAAVNHDTTIDDARIIGTSPSDTTTNVLTLGVGKTLTIAAGASLTQRGNANCGQGIFKLMAGAAYKWDASQATVPTTQYRTIWTANTAGKLVCEGTTDSWVTVTSDVAGGKGSFYPVSYGQVDCQYTAFSRLGFGVRLVPASGAVARLQHCTFDTCTGLTSGNYQGVLNVQNPHVNGTLLLDHVKTSNTTGRALYWQCAAGDGAITGQRTIQHCVFDVDSSFVTPKNTTVTDCCFDGLFNVSGTGWNWAEWRANLILTHVTAGVSIGGTMYDTYMVSDCLVNPHLATPTSDTVSDGWVLEWTTHVAGAPGDGFLLQNATFQWTIVRSILVVDDAGLANGTFLSGLGGANCSVSIEHCTFFTIADAGGGVRVGETYAGHAGMLTSFKSNLALGPEGAAGGYLFCRIGGGYVQDIVYAANVAGNWIDQYCAVGNEGNGFNHDGAVPLFSVGAPVPGGSGDAQCVDKTRNLAKWDAMLGGPGTAAHAIAEFKKITDPDYDSRYAIADALVWVEEGFRPQNAAMQFAGHDGTAPGACEYLASGNRRRRVLCNAA